MIDSLIKTLVFSSAVKATANTVRLNLIRCKLEEWKLRYVTSGAAYDEIRSMLASYNGWVVPFDLGDFISSSAESPQIRDYQSIGRIVRINRVRAEIEEKDYND
jgi:hypothetical protein